MRGSYAKNVIVENKAGAGGRLAVEELKRSAPDGTTLLVTPAAMITLYPHLYTKLGYGIDDVTPVSTVAQIVFAGPYDLDRLARQLRQQHRLCDEIIAQSSPEASAHAGHRDVYLEPVDTGELVRDP